MPGLPHAPSTPSFSNTSTAAVSHSAAWAGKEYVPSFAPQHLPRAQPSTSPSVKATPPHATTGAGSTTTTTTSHTATNTMSVVYGAGRGPTTTTTMTTTGTAQDSQRNGSMNVSASPAVPLEKRSVSSSASSATMTPVLNPSAVPPSRPPAPQQFFTPYLTSPATVPSHSPSLYPPSQAVTGGHVTPCSTYSPPVPGPPTPFATYHQQQQQQQRHYTPLSSSSSYASQPAAPPPHATVFSALPSPVMQYSLPVVGDGAAMSSTCGTPDAALYGSEMPYYGSPTSGRGRGMGSAAATASSMPPLSAPPPLPPPAAPPMTSSCGGGGDVLPSSPSPPAWLLPLNDFRFVFAALTWNVDLLRVLLANAPSPLIATAPQPPPPPPPAPPLFFTSSTASTPSGSPKEANVTNAVRAAAHQSVPQSPLTPSWLPLPPPTTTTATTPHLKEATLRSRNEEEEEIEVPTTMATAVSATPTTWSQRLLQKRNAAPAVDHVSLSLDGVDGATAGRSLKRSCSDGALWLNMARNAAAAFSSPTTMERRPPQASVRSGEGVSDVNHVVHAHVDSEEEEGGERVQPKKKRDEDRGDQCKPQQRDRVHVAAPAAASRSPPAAPSHSSSAAAAATVAVKTSKEVAPHPTSTTPHRGSVPSPAHPQPPPPPPHPLRHEGRRVVVDEEEEAPLMKATCSDGTVVSRATDGSRSSHTALSPSAHQRPPPLPSLVPLPSQASTAATTASPTYTPPSPWFNASRFPTLAEAQRLWREAERRSGRPRRNRFFIYDATDVDSIISDSLSPTPCASPTNAQALSMTATAATAPSAFGGAAPLATGVGFPLSPPTPSAFSRPPSSSLSTATSQTASRPPTRVMRLSSRKQSQAEAGDAANVQRCGVNEEERGGDDGVAERPLSVALPTTTATAATAAKQTPRPLSGAMMGPSVSSSVFTRPATPLRARASTASLTSIAVASIASSVRSSGSIALSPLSRDMMTASSSTPISSGGGGAGPIRKAHHRRRRRCGGGGGGRRGAENRGKARVIRLFMPSFTSGPTAHLLYTAPSAAAEQAYHTFVRQTLFHQRRQEENEEEDEEEKENVGRVQREAEAKLQAEEHRVAAAAAAAVKAAENGQREKKQTGAVSGGSRSSSGGGHHVVAVRDAKLMAALSNLYYQPWGLPTSSSSEEGEEEDDDDDDEEEEEEEDYGEHQRQNEKEHDEELHHEERENGEANNEERDPQDAHSGQGKAEREGGTVVRSSPVTSVPAEAHSQLHSSASIHQSASREGRETGQATTVTAREGTRTGTASTATRQRNSKRKNNKSSANEEDEKRAEEQHEEANPPLPVSITRRAVTLHAGHCFSADDLSALLQQSPRGAAAVVAAKALTTAVGVVLPTNASFASALSDESASMRSVVIVKEDDDDDTDGHDDGYDDDDDDAMDREEEEHLVYLGRVGRDKAAAGRRNRSEIGAKWRQNFYHVSTSARVMSRASSSVTLSHLLSDHPATASMGNCVSQNPSKDTNASAAAAVAATTSSTALPPSAEKASESSPLATSNETDSENASPSTTKARRPVVGERFASGVTAVKSGARAYEASGRKKRLKRTRRSPPAHQRSSEEEEEQAITAGRVDASEAADEEEEASRVARVSVARACDHPSQPCPSPPPRTSIEFFLQKFLRAVLIVVIAQVRLRTGRSMVASPSPSRTATDDAAAAPSASRTPRSLSREEYQALSFVRLHLTAFREMIARYVMRSDQEVLRRSAQAIFVDPASADGHFSPCQPSHPAGSSSKANCEADDVPGGGTTNTVCAADAAAHDAHIAGPPMQSLSSTSSSSAPKGTDRITSRASDTPTVPSEVGDPLFQSTNLHRLLSADSVHTAWQCHAYQLSLQQQQCGFYGMHVPPPDDVDDDVDVLRTTQLYLSGKDAAWQPLLMELLDVTRVLQCYADAKNELLPTTQPSTSGSANPAAAAAAPAAVSPSSQRASTESSVFSMTDTRAAAGATATRGGAGEGGANDASVPHGTSSSGSSGAAVSSASSSSTTSTTSTSGFPSTASAPAASGPTPYHELLLRALSKFVREALPVEGKAQQANACGGGTTTTANTVNNSRSHGTVNVSAPPPSPPPSASANEELVGDRDVAESVEASRAPAAAAAPAAKVPSVASKADRSTATQTSPTNENAKVPNPSSSPAKTQRSAPPQAASQGVPSSDDLLPPWHVVHSADAATAHHHHQQQQQQLQQQHYFAQQQRESAEFLRVLEPYLSPTKRAVNGASGGGEGGGSGSHKVDTDPSATVTDSPCDLLAPLRWVPYAYYQSAYHQPQPPSTVAAPPPSSSSSSTTPGNSTNSGNSNNSCAIPPASASSTATAFSVVDTSMWLHVTTLPLSGRLVFRWVIPAEDTDRYNLSVFFQSSLFSFLQGGPPPPPTLEQGLRFVARHQTQLQQQYDVRYDVSSRYASMGSASPASAQAFSSAFALPPAMVGASSPVLPYGVPSPVMQSTPSADAPLPQHHHIMPWSPLSPPASMSSFSALVHCSAGMHRSCGMVIAFLLWLLHQCDTVTRIIAGRPFTQGVIESDLQQRRQSLRKQQRQQQNDVVGSSFVTDKGEEDDGAAKDRTSAAVAAAVAEEESIRNVLQRCIVHVKKQRNIAEPIPTVRYLLQHFAAELRLAPQ